MLRACRTGLWVALCAACEVGQASRAEDPGARATLLAEVDVDRECNIAGVTEVQLQARPVACDPDCVLDGPAILGTLYSCPASQFEATLAVEVGEPGAYWVELVTRQTTGEQTLQCFVPPGGSTGATVRVSDEELEMSAEVDVVRGGDACRELAAE